MNLSSLKNLATNKIGRQLLTIQKHSPALLLGAGVVGVVATTVIACRATLKVSDILDEHHSMSEKIDNLEDPDYSEDDRKKDKVVLYVNTSSKLIKIYSPAVMIGLASVSFLAGSHHIMAQRNAGLMAAYTALEKGFNQYRKRVITEVGEEKEREFRYNTETREFVEETNEGPVVTRQKRVTGDPSIYAKLFDERSQSWSPVPEYNLLFLKCQQNFANDKLKSRGHVFLNEVYDSLGIDRTKEGAVVGWVRGKGGDDYIDFGVFDKEMQPQHFDFFTGRENAVWLDFNVDGVVYDKI